MGTMWTQKPGPYERAEVTLGTVWTQKPGLVQREQEKNLRLRQRGQEDISQMVQFFRNSTKCLIFSALTLLSFKHRASQEKCVSGSWHLWGIFRSPDPLGGKQTPPRSFLSDQFINASFSSICPKHKTLTRCLKLHMHLDRRKAFYLDSPLMP